MAVINTNLVCDLQHAVKVQYLDGNIFSQDNQGNVINVTVLDGGEPATLSGTISANIIRADGGTVAATGGTITDNVASITLPAAAYAIPGVVSIVIKNTNSSVVTTIAAIVANVYQSSTDTVVDPGTIIPSVQTLISAIETAVASIPADYSSLWTSLAPAFNSSSNYVTGQYVTYNGGLYRFTTAHSGSWSSSDVVATNLGGDVSDLKSAFEATTGNKGIAFENNKTINTSGSTVDITTKYNSTTMRNAVVDVSEGDKFTINGTGGVSARLWCFIDSEGNVLRNAPESSIAINKVIAAPANSTKLIIQTQLTDDDSLVGELIKLELEEEINNVNNMMDLFLNKELVVFENGKTINTSGSTVNTSTKYTNALMRNAVLNVSEGDAVTINGTGGNTANLWCFIDASNNVISKSEPNETAVNKMLTAPPGSNRLIIQTQINDGDSYIRYSLDKDAKNINNKLNEISEEKFINLFSTDYESGAINASDGTNAENNKRRRTTEYITDKYTKAKVNNQDGFDIAVFCWKNSTYMGCYLGEGHFTKSTVNWVKQIDLPYGYKYRIVFRRTDTSDCQNFDSPVAIYWNEPIDNEKKVLSRSDSILNYENLEYVGGKYRDDNGDETANYYSGYTKTKLSVKPSTKYNIKNCTNHSVFRIYFLDSEGDWIERTDAVDCYNGMQFKTPSNCYYVQFQVGLGLQFIKETRIEETVQTTPVFLDAVSEYSSTDLPSNASKATTGGVSEIYAEYDALVTAYPDYVSKTVLGRDQSDTFDILEYRFRPETVGYNSEHFGSGYVETKNEVDLPLVLVDGCIHGDEKLASLTIMNFFKKLCNSWASNRPLTFFRWNFEFRVIPIVNPWGYNANVRTNSESIDINRQSKRSIADLETDCIEGAILKTWLEKYQYAAFAYLDCHTQWAGKDRDIAWYISPCEYLDGTLNSVITKLSRIWKSKYSFIDYDGLMGFVGRAAYMAQATVGTDYRDCAFYNYGYKNAITVECANTAQYNSEDKFGELTTNMYMDIFTNLLVALAQIAGASYVPLI